MGFSQTAWVLIAFILFFLLVGKKLWSVISSNLDARKKLIEDELLEAKKLREEAQTELNNSLKKKKEINNQVTRIVNDAKLVAEKIKEDAEQKANNLIKRKEMQAKQKIRTAQFDAINEIKNMNSKLSINLVKAYLKTELNVSSHKELYLNSTNELKKKL